MKKNWNMKMMKEMMKPSFKEKHTKDVSYNTDFFLIENILTMVYI